MIWTALIPINLGRERKSRLAERLSAPERTRLADAMSEHVVTCLRETPEISKLVVLSPVQPAHAGVEWRGDLGRGLNAELAALREVLPGPLLVVLGDLPLLNVEDVRALLAAAVRMGIALAPDRHGIGTNAVALMPDMELAFAFGEDSCARHWQAAGGEAAIVSRPGLAHDVDTLADLDAAVAAGWCCKTPRTVEG